MAFAAGPLSTALGVAGLGLSAMQSAQGAKSQKRALNFQTESEGRAKAAASAQRLKSEESIRKADRKKPDIAALLNAAKQDGQTGFGSTQLTQLGA